MPDDHSAKKDAPDPVFRLTDSETTGIVPDTADKDAASTLLSLADLAGELEANVHISWREAFRRLAAEIHAAAFCARITPPGTPDA